MNPENDALQLKKAEDLFIRNCVNDALPVFKELANHGNGRALYFMGEYSNMDGQDFLKTLPQHFPITAREWKREMPFVN